MKEESVLSILMYLFHYHMGKSDSAVNLSDMAIVDELKSAGFHVHSIGKAFRWLNHLAELSDTLPRASAHSFRVFSKEESSLMDEECRRFILSLEQQGILTPVTREIVIHQTMELIHEGIDLSLIKWVTLMVLFNLPNCEEALAHMEFLVQTDIFDTVH